MIYAKWTEPLLGGEWAKKGTLDDPLPKQVDPNGFGPNDLEEDASMVLKATRPRDTILELTGKMQEWQNEINCMSDSRDFQDC